jgi:hypothetical protein
MDAVQVYVVLGVAALCAIVGIYYIWVRKLPKPANEPPSLAEIQAPRPK